jgi:hypothetical protein
MMLKCSGTGAYDFGEPSMSLIKLRHDGRLGPHDRSVLEKRAGVDFLERLRHVKLAEGEVPVHLIALGATEDFGCFATGTPIAAADGAYRDVESIDVADEVLSAEGRIMPVTATFRKTVPVGTRVDVSGFLAPLVCSVDHPFRVARREQFSCDHDRYKRCLPPTKGVQNICNRTKDPRECVVAPYREIAVEWSGAANLREGDFLVWTAPSIEPPRVVGIDEAYLIGAWLAEGCFTRNAGNKAISALRLSIGIVEDSFTTAITRAAVRSGMLFNIWDGEADRGERVVFVNGNADRCREYYRWFGEHATAKRLPPWVCCLSREARLSLIAGYMDGDGSCAVSDKENRTTARTHGRDLALGMQRLLWSVGSPATVCPVRPNPGEANGGYNISFPNSQLSDLVHYSWKFRPRDLKQTTKVHGFFHRGRMYLPVRNIAGIDTPFDVYNFEVDHDHTYSGPNIDSHNCNRNGDGFTRRTCREHHPSFTKYSRAYRNHLNKHADRSYGRVIASEFNEPMKRIELLVGYNGTEKAAEINGGLVADKELEVLNTGGDIPVSMACKVAHDTCSGCGNRARTRAEYCQGAMCKYGGLKDNIGRTFDDGHILHADNPDPVWFDISHVHKPADRIAWSLGRLEKAASTGIRLVGLGGAALAEEIGLTMPYELMVDPFMPAWVAQHVKTAYALAETERRVEAEGSHAHDRAFRPEVQDRVRDFPDQLNTRGRLEQMLGALAAEKVALSLRDFLTLVAGDEKQADEANDDVAAQLPGIYGRLTRNPAFDTQVRDNLYAIPGGCPPLAMRLWAAKYAATHGLRPDQVDSRISTHALRGLPAPRARAQDELMLKQAADMGGAEKLARQYALYKLALAAALRAESEQTFPLTLTLLVRQNYVA